MTSAPPPSPLGLPLFLNQKNKYPAGIIMISVACALYMASNHYHFLEPHLLPMTWIDRNFPFIPQTVFIYISEYVYFLLIYLTCKDMVNTNKYLYAFIGLQLTSVIIFWVWPTTYPRDLYPLSQNLDPITLHVFASLREADTPANCCPSLHVSTVFLSAYIFLNEQREKFPLFMTWGLLIALSTLPTKQHYVIDLVTGAGMSILAYWIFYRVIPYRAQAKR
jgi:membrane-associated phospholipid phosphatase